MNNIYYIDDNTKQQFGPFEIEDLRTKNIRPHTMIWASGMSDWTEVRNVPELHMLFAAPAGSNIGSQQTPPPVNTSPPGSLSRYGGNVYGGAPTHPVNEHGQMMPKTWLVESILLTILCCSPISIVGIFYASKVSGLYNAGDYYSAVSASKDAKTWTLVGVGIVVGVCVLSLFIAIIGEL